MKLKTLLESFDFDDLFPSITNMYPNAKRHRAEFKQAFDICMRIRPAFTNKAIRYQLMDSPHNNDSYYGASDTCFKGTWDLILGKDVNRSKGVDLTDEDMAANSLLCMIFLSTPPAEFKDIRDHLVRV